MSETPIKKVKLYLSFEERIIEMKRLVEEEIIYIGKLKGKKFPSGPKTYKIIDVDGLISELAKALVSWAGEPTRQILTKVNVGKAFRGIMKELNGSVMAWSILTEVNPEKHLRRIREELKTWERRIQARLPKIDPLSSPGSIADTLESILRSHVHNAPSSTIAERISDLLKLIDTEMQPETIRKRITRKVTT